MLSMQHIIGSLEYQIVGMIVVFACLGFLAIILGISAKICSMNAEKQKPATPSAPQKPVTVATSSPQPDEEGLSPEMVAVISAAVATTLQGLNHRIVDIQQHSRSYASEGRNEIFASHQLPRHIGR